MVLYGKFLSQKSTLTWKYIMMRTCWFSYNDKYHMKLIWSSFTEIYFPKQKYLLDFNSFILDWSQKENSPLHHCALGRWKMCWSWRVQTLYWCWTCHLTINFNRSKARGYERSCWITPKRAWHFSWRRYIHSSAKVYWMYSETQLGTLRQSK